MRCRYAPVHDEVRGICDALGLDYDRIATDRAGMLWAGEGMPHRFDACCEISDIIIRSAFYYILLPSLFAMALPLLLYELLELHDRRRL